jgi:hypothetical protein
MNGKVTRIKSVSHYYAFKSYWKFVFPAEEAEEENQRQVEAERGLLIEAAEIALKLKDVQVVVPAPVLLHVLSNG